MRDILGTGQHDMRNWSQRRLIATLAIAAIVVLEPVSWITASVPPCILDPADYAADFTEHYQCPTLYGFLLRHARTLYAFLTEPQVATVAVPLILAVSTLFLWWYSTRKLARAAIAAARAAQTSADALMAAPAASARGRVFCGSMGACSTTTPLGASASTGFCRAIRWATGSSPISRRSTRRIIRIRSLSVGFGPPHPAVIAGLDPQVGFTRLAAPYMQNSGKPEFCAIHPLRNEPSCEEDGCAGQARA
jgi:hypothetical protein